VQVCGIVILSFNFLVFVQDVIGVLKSILNTILVRKPFLGVELLKMVRLDLWDRQVLRKTLLIKK
jgi:hypothetical protein